MCSIEPVRTCILTILAGKIVKYAFGTIVCNASIARAFNAVLYKVLSFSKSNKKTLPV